MVIGIVPRIDLLRLSKAAGVKSNTMSRYMSDLRRSGLMIKDRHEPVCGHRLTNDGWKEYKRMYPDVMKIELVPEMHSVSITCTLNDVLPLLNEPENIIRVLVSTTMRKKLDVVALIQLDKALDTRSRDNTLIRELERTKGDLDRSFTEMVGDLTLIGKKPQEIDRAFTTYSISSMIIQANILQRQSYVKEACDIFFSILDREPPPHPSYRIFSAVGYIHCIKVLEGQEKALTLNDRFLEAVSSPPYRVVLNKSKADILQEMDRSEEAAQLYDSCLKSLNRLDLPLLRSVILNNIGVLHFKQNNEKLGLDYWKKSISISKELDLPWIKAITMVNMSDAYARVGKVKRARDMLREARSFFESVGDMEGLSGVDFNMALVCIEEGKKELSLKYFSECEKYPLLYTKKRQERRDVMGKRFDEKGWDDPFR